MQAYVRTYVRMYVRTDGRACVRTYVRKPTCTYAPTTLCGTHMSTYVRAQSTSKLFHIWHYYVPRGVFRPPYVSTVRTYPNGRWLLSPPQCTAFEALMASWLVACASPPSILAGRLRITARHPSPGGRGSSCGGSCPFCSRASTPLCTSSALREKQAQRPP